MGAVLYSSERSRLFEWVSLIVAPGGPLGLKFYGYVTRREWDGVHTVEPALVEGRYVA